jgi:hypothetical protein
LEPGEDEAVVSGVLLPRNGAETLEFLTKNDFYSLIYIFSNENVQEEFGSDLRKKFRKRIRFKRKSNLNNEAARIAKDIIRWRNANKNLSLPSEWTKTINLSVQQILLELASADENWIKELGKTADKDGASGEIFIIEILQNLLAESLVQNKDLINSVRAHIDAAEEIPIPQNEKSIAKLFRRVFYTKIDTDAPIMTGDICKIGRNKFGIIVTPECDIDDVIRDETKTFELLTFTRTSFDEFLSLQMNFTYQRELYDEWDAAPKNRDKLDRLGGRFNNGDSKYHILPSFPINKKNFNLSVVIDLSSGCERYSCNQIRNKRAYKLNSPFIQQLRQRYIAHLGRVGTPSLPASLRNFNLKPSRN